MPGGLAGCGDFTAAVDRCLSGALWGHLVHIDHGNNTKVKGTSVTSYKTVFDATGPTTTRHIEGTCEVDALECTYSVDVADNGEPGRNDMFAISLSDGSSASGALAGGNIQLHTPCQ